MTPKEKSLLLMSEAKRWVGIQEVGGNNRGQLVEIFLRDSGVSPGDPWCLAFAQECIRQVDRVALALDSTALAAKSPKGAHCLTFWNESPPELKSASPIPGSIVIWHHLGGSSGHAGICTGVSADGARYFTIEGNTSPEDGVHRDGDGVFAKSHGIAVVPGVDTVRLGFVMPWGT